MTLTKPDAVCSFSEALASAEANNQQDQAEQVREICLPTLMTHGAPTEWALVFLHGFTNCPEQFRGLAHGLGERVMVVGFSGGATVAAWLAQNRPDLDSAVVMAAMMGVSFNPSTITRPFAWLISRIPDFYIWNAVTLIMYCCVSMRSVHKSTSTWYNQG